MTRNYKSLSTALTSRGMLLRFKENELIARCGHDIMKKFSEQYSHARYYIYCKLIFSIDTWYMIQCKFFEINVCHYTCSSHTCVLGGLTRRFQPVHQQKELRWSDATTFDQNKQFLSIFPRTGFNTEFCSYFSLS